MLPDTIRNIRIGLAVFVVLIFGSVYGYFHFQQRRMIDGLREQAAKGERRDPATGSKRIAQVSDLAHKDIAGALKVADQILAKPESDREKRSMLAQLPQLLASGAEQQLERGQRAEAQALRERLERQFPSSSSIEQLRGAWLRHFERRAVEALRGPDLAAGETAVRELWAQQPREIDALAFETLANERRRRWQAAAQAKAGDALDRLRGAAAVFVRRQQIESLGGDLRILPQDATALAALGDEAARGPQRHVALTFWQGALAKLRDFNPTWKGETLNDPKRLEAAQNEVRRKLAAGWTELGDRLYKRERVEYVVMSPRKAYEGAAYVARGLVEEMEALTRRLEFEAADVAAAAAPVLALPFARLGDPSKLESRELDALDKAARETAQRVRTVLERAGLRLWECCLETPAFDPWPTVPVAVREDIDAPPATSATPPSAKLPAPRGAAPATPPTAQAVETQRRKKLLAYYNGDQLHIPLGELDPLRATLHQVYARWGQWRLKDNAEEALTMLREVLRESADATLRQNLVETLRARLASARQGGDFETFFVVAGFYVAELGVPARGDAFRDQFRAGLEAAAGSFKQGGGQMKKIFIQSLLAKGFPDEAVGRDALREASTAAFAAVATAAQDKPNPVIRPSPLPGHAVHLINNGTEHHLLAFYKGPSLTMVHYWPWRRGTVVIPEGTYELVVLSPSASIRPYREQASPASGVRFSEYVIKRSGPGAGTGPQPSGSLARGDYVLLHAPAGLKQLKVEPRTGVPVGAK